MRWLIVHPSSLFAEALAAALDTSDPVNSIRVIATDSIDLIEEEVNRLPPDLLVIPHGPGNLGAMSIQRILKSSPRILIVVVEVPENDTEIIRLIRYGAVGYAVQGAQLGHLQANLEAVTRGETLCSARIARLLFSHLSLIQLPHHLPSPALSHANSLEAHLTRREIEIIALIEQDMQNKEIARNLGIEVQTVKNHVHNILEKLQVRGRHDAVRYAKEVGLLTGPHVAISISTSTSKPLSSRYTLPK